MPDDSLRALERRFKETGAEEDERRWLAARLRAEALAVDRLELAAHLGHPAAVAAAGGDERLPRRLFAPGVALELPPPAPPATLPVTAETLDDDLGVRLTLHGELSGPNVERLYLLSGALVAMGARRLLVDVGRLTYLSSSGLMVLIRVGDRLRDRRGAFGLGRVGDRVSQVIEILGLEALLPDVSELTFEVPGEAPADPDPERTRVLGLARWGTEACVRAALACAPRPGPGRAAAEAWLRSPSEERRLDAESVRLERSAAQDPYDAFLAALTAGGAWPSLDLPAELRLPAVRAALVPWALS
jgi:stage II sporulation protein AA (anti-sigma F factor antagonist)